eukprot:15472156-Alexandrium_andersonii.AAC.1
MARRARLGATMGEAGRCEPAGPGRAKVVLLQVRLWASQLDTRYVSKLWRGTEHRGAATGLVE